MVEVMATVLTYVALGAAAWAVVLIIAGRPVMIDRWHGLGLLGIVALLELGLLVHAVLGVLNLVGTDRDVSTLSFLGYLIGPVFIVPLAAFWSLAERTRWGPGVMVIGCLTIPVMILRLRQIWEADA